MLHQNLDVYLIFEHVKCAAEIRSRSNRFGSVLFQTFSCSFLAIYWKAFIFCTMILCSHVQLTKTLSLSKTYSMIHHRTCQIATLPQYPPPWLKTPITSRDKNKNSVPENNCTGARWGSCWGWGGIGRAIFVGIVTCIFTTRFAKVMFLQACHSVHRRGLHPGGWGCLHPGAWAVRPTPSDTIGHGQWAGGMHPTGIHSCYLRFPSWTQFGNSNSTSSNLKRRATVDQKILNFMQISGKIISWYRPSLDPLHPLAEFCVQFWSCSMGMTTGNMIISTSMNINLGHLGGASILRMFTTTRPHGSVNTTTWLAISQFF